VVRIDAGKRAKRESVLVRVRARAWFAHTVKMVFSYYHDICIRDSRFEVGELAFSSVFVLWERDSSRTNNSLYNLRSIVRTIPHDDGKDGAATATAAVGSNFPCLVVVVDDDSLCFSSAPVDDGDALGGPATGNLGGDNKDVSESESIGQ
jgi:hypothetical protein